MKMGQGTQLHTPVERFNNMKNNYAITELKELYIVWTVKHFHHYLYGRHCEVIALLNTPHPSGKLARWGL